MPAAEKIESVAAVRAVEPDVEKKPGPPAGGPPGGGPPGRTPPPDGGRDAWLTVLGSFCGMFVSFGWINCIGVFQDYYESHQLKNLSPSTVAWIPSLETFMMFIGGPIGGTIFDYYGPRHMLIIGTFFQVFGLMMASISSEYYQFILAQGICSPLGASCIFYGCVNSVSTWFHHRRALALGIMASGSSLGGVVYPIMVDHLIPKLGFAWAMRICAFLILGLLIVTNFTVRSRLTHTRKKFDALEFVRPLKEAKYSVTVLAAFCFFWGMFLPFTFVITQAEEYGMSARLASYLIPILNASSVFGRTIPGWLADRFGRYNVMTIFTGFSAIIVLALWMPSRSNAPVIVFTALYGFSSGAFISLGPALIAQISDIRKMGVRNGTFFAIISIAALTGSPIGGALVPDVLTDSYDKLQIFCGVTMLAGTVFFAVARVLVGGPQLLKKV
ncbi:hypothetical protein ASPZODRAFT_59824 [Penicilliopsis zonata CBS 506.65]|uniref:Major facilitator superfamily (MFS) profile domain-containing protein n=1 Tax=Penicilliopsis zonata CBS 506.65 TaxID=1073090 RepID=A0A1L9SPV9_9EURO|nr:hypothetical protein ASPZODRAFT_59824 [Penicilliopsis zonata CBS 506.65]OJJ49156.1 hypothetical protein ASPZODRAFT_59824 [Penicilliopsis zonata CBS 506.65]